MKPTSKITAWTFFFLTKYKNYIYIHKTRIFFFLCTETVLGLASSFQITIWKHFYKPQLSKMDMCFNNLYPVLLDISCLSFEFWSSPCSLPLSRDDWFIVSRTCSVVQHISASAWPEDYWFVLCPIILTHLINCSFFPINLTSERRK